LPVLGQSSVTVGISAVSLHASGGGALSNATSLSEFMVKHVMRGIVEDRCLSLSAFRLLSTPSPSFIQTYSSSETCNHSLLADYAHLRVPHLAFLNFPIIGALLHAMLRSPLLDSYTTGDWSGAGWDVIVLQLRRPVIKHTLCLEPGHLLSATFQ
jgi:hypothetical protein